MCPQQAVEELGTAIVRAVYGRAHPHRPAHAARRLPPSAPRRGRGLPARVRRAGPARPPLVHRLGDAARLLRGGRGARRAGRRLPRLRPCREAEPAVGLPADGPELPESRFVVAETLVPLRPRRGHGGGAGGRRGRGRRAARGRACVSETQAPSQRATMRRTPTGPRAERGVERIREHIRAGDAFQVVLSQRAERQTSASALELYRALRRVNPSPYLFLLELGAVALVGSSPETLVKCEDGRASLNPIADDPPGEGDAERLLASEKDRAEHVMLVDLGRNDLSRVCRPASVRVARFLEPERFSHVTHLVSRGDGRAARQRDRSTYCGRASRRHGLGRAEGASDADRLRARALPAPSREAVDYVLQAAMDTCIAIRTIVLTATSRGCRREQGSWQTPIRPPSTRCLSKLAALEAAIDSPRKASLEYSSCWTTTTATLQASSTSSRRTTLRGSRLPERRDHGRRGRSTRADAPRRLPRPRAS